MSREKHLDLLWEQTYPYVFAIAAGAAWFHWDVKMPDKDFTSLLSAALTLGAILTGFLATSKTILFGMRSSNLMRQLRKAGYEVTLMSYLGQGIWLSFLFSIVCLVGFFVPTEQCNLFGTVWFTMGVLAGMAFFRVTRIILLLLQREEENDEDGPFKCNYDKKNN